MFLSFEYQCDNAFEACLAAHLPDTEAHCPCKTCLTFLYCQFLKNLVHILVEILVFACISCRIDAGGAAKAVNFKSRIIGKTIASTFVEKILSFL